MKIRGVKLLNFIMIGLILFSFSRVMAQSCPEKTTVNGPKSITFVGGVADLGGDTQASVWFEYGTSSGNYTFKTEKKVVTQTGKYCITVDNLQPCTTYYYRAAMENQAGPSYGAELSKMTTCQEKKVLGAATAENTGIIETIFLDYLFLPLISALFLIFIFKNDIFRLERWLNIRKNEYQEYKSKKILEKKIKKIKNTEN
jgi:hypothetical protein